jgi:hypothetical protein
MYLFVEPDSAERSLWMGPKITVEEEMELYRPD